MSAIVDSIVEWGQNCEFVAKCPQKVTLHVKEFCDDLGAEHPEFLTIRPTLTAQPAFCFKNVMEAVEAGKGSLQAGWSIWQMRNAYLVAERHAILRTDSGLVDITPQFDGTNRIAFACTEEIPASFSMPCSYFPLTDHPLVLRSLELMRRNSELFFRGGFRSREFLRNDRESATCLRSYFLIDNKRSNAATRKKRKAERQRRKRSRK
ncbi:MAG: hypothetical protein KDA66_18060 [Planctomycetaceae bacterium]|nr:hypothetical protein [Planctomycetaceae bacterium]